MLIVAAGPLFNFALAIVLYWAIFVVGVQGLKPVIAAPVAGSVAAHTQLKTGAKIMMVGDEPIPTWTELRPEIIEHALAKPSSEERRVGKEGVRTCGTRGTPSH